MKTNIAIIQFPGSNCEYETQRAFAAYGFKADIIRWNCDIKDFNQYSGYVLPGGFSYQDRIRAGVISAKLPIVHHLVQAAKTGKPLLGICNGCQILAETGLIPDLENNQTISVALAPNTKNNQPVGFICDWVYVKIKNPEKSIFTKHFTTEDILPIQINHAEGNFILDKNTKEKLKNLTTFQYCDSNGELGNYPITPNGSTDGLAGICNKKGNVMAIMPHPERATFLKQTAPLPLVLQYFQH